MPSISNLYDQIAQIRAASARASVTPAMIGTVLAQMLDYFVSAEKVPPAELTPIFSRLDAIEQQTETITARLETLYENNAKPLP